MADRIIFMTSPPPDLIGGVFVSIEMVEDLKLIAQLPSEAIDELATALVRADGFLNEEGLKEIVRDAISEESAAFAVLSAIQNIRPGQVDQVIAALQDWRRADPKYSERLPDDSFLAIQANLARLIRDYPAWDRFRKARRLASVTGNRARQVELICDARPVFDRDRQQIEGFIPLTTLKLVYESQAGETGCIEFVLPAGVLEQLLDKAKKAQHKISALREALDLIDPT